jgi:pseudaminic acid cytidylyltransferase
MPVHTQPYYHVDAMKIAVIPARGGSKRIPGKNIKPFCGKPMIAWSIEAARVSRLFERILVSTDDEHVAEIARAWGAEVPFLRPVELAGDFVGTAPVIAHAVQWAQAEALVDAVCCIYATAPFIQVEDLRRGLEELERGGWDFVFAATEYAAPIFRSFKETAGGGVEMFFPEHLNTRSQDLPRALHDAAQFYWGTPAAWLENNEFFGPSTRALIIPRWRVQDIDTTEDWERAEMMAQIILKKRSQLQGAPGATS